MRKPIIGAVLAVIVSAALGLGSLVGAPFITGGPNAAEAHFGTHGSTVTVIGHAFCGYRYFIPGPCAKVTLTTSGYSRTTTPAWTGGFTFTGVPYNRWATLTMVGGFLGGIKCTKSVYINDPWFGTVDLHGLLCTN